MDAVLGTAGHIDHGKTSLVRALTGINCDRLEEEKRRGITIDLGFAWLDMPDKRRLGIVDVPGHERFVKTMVAGAAGIDCMLLVIAADEGMMPQTKEHLDICTLLGVRSGLVALTKTDMVELEWLEMVQEDIKEGLQGTFLRDAPIIPVSSATGAGIDTLRTTIFDMVATIKPRVRTDILRLPVDRIFTLKGFGTVVTGTLVSGTCKQGEELCLTPSGKNMRARSLQVHGVQVAEGRHGQRCAMNLQGVEVDEIQRGDIISRPNSLFPSRRWIVKLTCLPSAPHPIRQRMEVHFHHGAKECAARIIFRDRIELLHGETGLAEVHLKEPIAGVFGDHCVMRAHSPLRTIAGGVVIDPLPPVLRRRDPYFGKKMELLEELGKLAAQGPENLEGEALQNLLRICLDLWDAPGVDEKRLNVLVGVPATDVRAALEILQKSGEAICWDVSTKNWVGKVVFEDSISRCLRRASELHEREPLKSFFAHNALCSGWGENLPQRYVQKVLEEAVARKLLREEGNGLKMADWEVRPDEGQSAILKSLLEIYEKNALTPPLFKEIQESIDADARQLNALVSHLCETGQLCKVQEGLYYSRPVLREILQKVRHWFDGHDTLDVSDMKTILGVSRKYAIPLLEYMDAARLTLRMGNERHLRNKGEWNI